MIGLLRFFGVAIVLVGLVSAAMAAGSAFIQPSQFGPWLNVLIAIVPSLGSIGFGLLVAAAGSALEIAENIERRVTK